MHVVLVVAAEAAPRMIIGGRYAPQLTFETRL